MQIHERARAKINLTLRVLGRRADGYHALESLVSFAALADEVLLDVDQPAGVATSGPFAGAIDGKNLLLRTLEAVREREPRLQLGAVGLTKMLPVAAGLGGGSADAAALLRALMRTPRNTGLQIDWYGLAARLGADVPVCLRDAPVLMWGAGERLSDLPRCVPKPAPMPAVLVNPRLPLATREVFQALGAKPAPAALPAPDASALAFRSVADVVACMRETGNDLEEPAQRLLPAIGEIKAALAGQAQCLHAAMSGSGPTCFALFASEDAAQGAAGVVQGAQPGWWVAATAIDFPAGR